MRITNAQTQALATFVSRIRDDWDHPGIVAAITKAAPLGNAADIGTALCRLAANTELRSPALLAEPGSHWRDTTVASLTPPVMCNDHPTQLARECPDCRAASLRTDHARGAAAVRAQMKPRPKPVARREPPPRDLALVRERADAEAAS